MGSNGYAKLFGSILASTIWQAPDHVRLVWITMLAMKDRDGVVEASIPGLAHVARVTVAQAEEAIATLLAPDPYSRTPDHEGRRIEPTDGGWRLLNADKYRDKLDHDDQREKAATRKRRQREREASRDVTPGHAESRDVRHADTDTDTDLEPLPVPDLPLPELPDPRARVGADLGADQIPLPVRAPLDAARDAARPAEASLVPELQRTQEQLQAHGKARMSLWALLEAERDRVATELGAKLRPLHAMDPGERALGCRLREAQSLDVGIADAKHVIGIAVAEALASGSAQWLTGVVFEDRQWRRLLAMTVDDAKREGAKKAAIAARASPGSASSTSRGTSEPQRRSLKPA